MNDLVEISEKELNRLKTDKKDMSWIAGILLIILVCAVINFFRVKSVQQELGYQIKLGNFSHRYLKKAKTQFRINGEEIDLKDRDIHIMVMPNNQVYGVLRNPSRESTGQGQ